jgi:hypothetical protein
MLININGAAINTTATGEDVVTVVQNATNLNQLHDVDTNSGLTDNDLLQYDSTAGTWQNTQQPYLSSIEIPISPGITIESVNASFGSKIQIQTFSTVDAPSPGDVYAAFRVNGRKDDGTGGDEFNTMLNLYQTDGGGGDINSLFYLVGDNSEFTSQNFGGDLTPFVFNTSEVGFNNAENINWDSPGKEWTIAASDQGGRNNGKVLINGGLQLSVQDGWPLDPFSTPNDLTKIQMGSNFITFEADQNFYLDADEHQYRDTSSNAVMTLNTTGSKRLEVAVNEYDFQDNTGTSKFVIDNNNSKVTTEWPVKFYNVDLTTYTGPTESGMVVFDTNDSKLKVYDGSAWTALH